MDIKYNFVAISNRNLCEVDIDVTYTRYIRGCRCDVNFKIDHLRNVSGDYIFTPSETEVQDIKELITTSISENISSDIEDLVEEYYDEMMSDLNDEFVDEFGLKQRGKYSSIKAIDNDSIVLEMSNGKIYIQDEIPLSVNAEINMDMDSDWSYAEISMQRLSPLGQYDFNDNFVVDYQDGSIQFFYNEDNIEKLKEKFPTSSNSTLEEELKSICSIASSYLNYMKKEVEMNINHESEITSLKNVSMHGDNVRYTKVTTYGDNFTMSENFRLDEQSFIHIADENKAYYKAVIKDLPAFVIQNFAIITNRLDFIEELKDDKLQELSELEKENNALFAHFTMGEGIELPPEMYPEPELQNEIQINI